MCALFINEKLYGAKLKIKFLKSNSKSYEFRYKNFSNREHRKITLKKRKVKIYIDKRVKQV